MNSFAAVLGHAPEQQQVGQNYFGDQPLKWVSFQVVLTTRGATLITSQLPVPSWFDIVGDPTMADAILDRLVHNAHKIELKGDSLRKTKGQKDT